jgi:hypothetical protein
MVQPVRTGVIIMSIKVVGIDIAKNLFQVCVLTNPVKPKGKINAQSKCATGFNKPEHW